MGFEYGFVSRLILGNLFPSKDKTAYAFTYLFIPPRRHGWVDGWMGRRWPKVEQQPLSENYLFLAHYYINFHFKIMLSFWIFWPWSLLFLSLNSFHFCTLPCSFLLVCSTPLCLRLKSEGQHVTGYLVQIMPLIRKLSFSFTKQAWFLMGRDADSWKEGKAVCSLITYCMYVRYNLSLTLISLDNWSIVYWEAVSKYLGFLLHNYTVWNDMRLFLCFLVDNFCLPH